MAVDAAIETLSPPFHSPSHFSPQGHFYLAVDGHHFKMETLMDLLGVAGRRPGLPMVVCCSSRDELDAVCSAVTNVPYISLASLINFQLFFFHPQSLAIPSYSYTDLAEADRSLILEHFRQATMRWNPEVSAQPAVDSESVKDEQKSHMIVATDACLPLLASGESPIAARVLINYKLPTKKVQLSFFLCELDLDVPQFHASIYADSYSCCAMFKVVNDRILCYNSC
ncbi:eukaryotic initiation factor 4A-like [Pyrus ussuriensis x Pyrus communis]|uniref:Eukaryotic initiation factor 4A-like n=1 Tax=Pyrus ussuriensis x Pyrus communis TaxID=2448454 RepID=A0A5N5HPQ5_9ROSA|nr:eukaryotic initiation factor 4A-like [Pyrus ussuriensis x Pyrus communis]